uniref:Uncharacterized protein n=1 Tax=Romanomermis culicivorax TaxID=13658 RepID=A0A915J8L6_ROMCU
MSNLSTSPTKTFKLLENDQHVNFLNLLKRLFLSSLTLDDNEQRCVPVPRNMSCDQACSQEFFSGGKHFLEANISVES